MLDKLITAAAWACLVFITYATLSSIDLRPEILKGGSLAALERFGAYAVLGLLYRLAYPRHLRFVCILVFGSALILELLQNLTPDRDARVLDAIEKLLGGAAGVLSGHFAISCFWPKTVSISARRDE